MCLALAAYLHPAGAVVATIWPGTFPAFHPKGPATPAREDAATITQSQLGNSSWGEEGKGERKSEGAKFRPLSSLSSLLLLALLPSPLLP